MQFRRKEWTTNGADPTTVVEWKAEAVTLVEFQGVIGVELVPVNSITDRFENYPKDARDRIQALGEALHKALESSYQAQQNVYENDDL